MTSATGRETLVAIVLMVIGVSLLPAMNAIAKYLAANTRRGRSSGRASSGISSG